MLIRHNLLRPDPFNPETAHHCAQLAREVISTLSAFVARYPFKRAFGYFCTASTVECAYYLVPVLRYSIDPVEQTASMIALQQARDILEQLEPKLNLAKTSLQALHGVLKRWGSGSIISSQAGSTTQDPEAPMVRILDTSIAPRDVLFMQQLTSQLKMQVAWESNPQTESIHAHADLQADLPDDLDPDEWLNLPTGAFFGGEFNFHDGP